MGGAYRRGLPPLPRTRQSAGRSESSRNPVPRNGSASAIKSGGKPRLPHHIGASRTSSHGKLQVQPRLDPCWDPTVHLSTPSTGADQHAGNGRKQRVSLTILAFTVF